MALFLQIGISDKLHAFFLHTLIDYFDFSQKAYVFFAHFILQVEIL